MSTHRTFVAILASFAAIGTVLGSALVFYLLWKNALGTVLAKIGTDVLRYGLVAAAIGSLCSLALARKNVRWVLVFCVGTVAFVAIVSFHASGVACTSKKLSVCEPLW